LGSILLAWLLVVISGIGAYLAEVFIGFVKRTKTYERHYLAWAALMEYDQTYIPDPHLWTNFLREFAEDINALNLNSKCWRQQKVLKTLNEAPYINLLVRPKRILPAIITRPNGPNGKYEVSDRGEESTWGTSAPGRPIPSGCGFRIYQDLPFALGFAYFFLMLPYSIICAWRVF
jgi:hypothetical protein